jgi:hypothetical protein
MSNTQHRLALCEEILELIERKRTETGDQFLGSAIERVVLDAQIRELEEDIFEDPGAFEPWLIRRRNSERH